MTAADPRISGRKFVVAKYLVVKSKANFSSIARSVCRLTDGRDDLKERPSGDGIVNADAAPRQIRHTAANVEAWWEAIRVCGVAGFSHYNHVFFVT